jgi:glyoxylase-like metal-dependent hydrolase (beta-lactamase superfamily II)
MLRSTTRVLSFIAVAALALTACSKNTPTVEQPPELPPEAPAVASTAGAVQLQAAPLKIGELSAMAVRDGTLELPNDNQVFGVGRTPEEVAAVLGANGLPTDKLHLSIQPLLVKAGDRVLLFDTGAGGNFGPGAGKLMSSLAAAGVEAPDVTDIFLSHAHGDHAGGLVNAQGALNFPNATIHLSNDEWQSLVSNEKLAALAAAIKAKVAGFAAGAEIIPGVVKAVDIKGHTPGHSGYLIGSGAESLLYVGDAMHHYVVSVRKPEWTISFDGDGAVASKSRADLIARSAATAQRIYAVHFPFPGVGKFEKRGTGFAWLAE